MLTIEKVAKIGEEKGKLAARFRDAAFRFSDLAKMLDRAKVSEYGSLTELRVALDLSLDVIGTIKQRESDIVILMEMVNKG